MRSHPNNQTGGGVIFAAESLVRFSDGIILSDIITLLPIGEIVRVSAYNKEQGNDNKSNRRTHFPKIEMTKQ